MAPRLPNLLVARLVAVILLIAAGLKIYGLRVEPIAGSGIFSAPEFQVALVEFEIVLGIWLWSGVRPILSWLVALVTFTAFAAASSYLAWIGQSSCGCFGNLQVNPVFALALDCAILTGLAFGRPDLKPLWNNPRRVLLEGTGSGMAVVVGMAAIFGLLLGAAQMAFGSLPEALAYFRGERVTVQPRLVDVGAGHLGEVRPVVVTIANWTDKPVRIIGASQDCSCRVDGLPLSIPAKESRSLSLTFQLSGTPGIFTRSTALLVDDDGLKQISFRFTGRVLPKQEVPAAEGG
jgi:hypothetical protein